MLHNKKSNSKLIVNVLFVVLFEDGRNKTVESLIEIDKFKLFKLFLTLNNNCVKFIQILFCKTHDKISIA